MDNSFYLPILKSKGGEFKALSKLGIEAIKKITPLFEVTPVEWDNYEGKKPKTIKEHLDNFCKKYRTKWPRDNCFIDVSLLKTNTQDDSNQIEYIYHELHKENFRPAPVIHFDSSEAFFEALERSFTILELNEIGLRLDLKNVMSSDLQENLERVFNRIHTNASKTHLIIDLRDANFSDIENFADGIIDLLEEFPYWSEWKSVTLAGTAFPKSGDIQAGLSEFLRNDWKFFNLIKGRLNKKSWDRGINFGDYSIVNPDYFEFDPIKMSASAKIRYTHNDKWIIAKGKSFKSAGFAQYKSLANSIYNSKYYLGEGFSAGSQYLAKCIRGEEKTGNSTTWVWVDTNHHFTKVLFDLFSILPGT